MCASPDLAEDQLVPYCRWSSIGRPTSPHPSKCMQEHHVKDWQKWKNYQKKPEREHPLVCGRSAFPHSAGEFSVFLLQQSFFAPPPPHSPLSPFGLEWLYCSTRGGMSPLNGSQGGFFFCSNYSNAGNYWFYYLQGYSHKHQNCFAQLCYHCFLRNLQDYLRFSQDFCSR